jgi:Fe2+ transport system protein FeoA
MDENLNDLSVGSSGTVIKVLGEGPIRRRLFDMGVTPGAKFYVRKKAPLGDPIEITIRGYELTLRKDEAKSIIVKANSDSEVND